MTIVYLIAVLLVVAAAFITEAHEIEVTLRRRKIRTEGDNR